MKNAYMIVCVLGLIPVTVVLWLREGCISLMSLCWSAAKGEGIVDMGRGMALVNLLLLLSPLVLLVFVLYSIRVALAPKVTPAWWLVALAGVALGGTLYDVVATLVAHVFSGWPGRGRYG